MNDFKALIICAVISLMTCLLCFWLALTEFEKQPANSRARDFILFFVFTFSSAFFMLVFIFTIEALVHI